MATQLSGDAARAHLLEDRLAVIPDFARDRFAWLEETTTILADQGEGLFTATEHARARLEAARTDRLHAEEVVRSEGGNPADVDKASAAEEKARKLYEGAAQRHRDHIREAAAIRDLFGDVKRALMGVPVEGLVDGRPRRAKGVPLADELDRLAKLQAERAEVQQAPVSIDEALQQVRRQVNEAANESVISVGGAAMPAQPDGRGGYRAAPVRIHFPMKALRAEPDSLHGNHQPPQVVDTEKVILGLLGKQLLPALEGEIREAYAVEGVTGISIDERRKRLRELDAEIDAAQRRAVEAAWEAIGKGQSVRWWADIPGLALLGLKAA